MLSIFMDNYAIADQFSLLAKLMDIHGENSFKSKSYSVAAYTIENLSEQLAALPEAKMAKIKGIGDSTAKKVAEILQTGELKTLQDLIAKTPSGVLQMMNIKGLGPKKINTLWKEMDVDSIAALEDACRENRIAQTKGFGEKTQQKIIGSIEFVRSNEGKFLYRQIEDFAIALQQKLEQKFPNEQTVLTGEFRRQLEVVGQLDWVTTASANELKNFLVNEQITLTYEGADLLSFSAEGTVALHFHLATKENFVQIFFATSGTEEFLTAWNALDIKADAKTEEELFESAGLSFIPPCLRESATIVPKAKTQSFEGLIQTGDIKGLIHSHSNWSDGSNTIEQMAQELIRLGFEYLVISDHSKAAYYAKGLSEERIKEQHRYIDELNEKFAPFKIFKSIECDILGDGALDYGDEVLSSFDLVITSVHSNLDMEEDKAMQRLLGAIANPYTTILGHMTGRLLLRRKGYPIDHKAIINACAEHSVVIEINAYPDRLDMDWRWIDYALQQGVLLSINPDAHSLHDFGNLKYGVLVAQKGGLTPARNLSSFGLKDFEAFLKQSREKPMNSK